MLVDKNIQKSLQQCSAKFAKHEDGAVSVDWVVLTAAIVGVAAGAVSTVDDSLSVLGGSISTSLADTEVDNGN